MGASPSLGSAAPSEPLASAAAAVPAPARRVADPDGHPHSDHSDEEADPPPPGGYMAYPLCRLRMDELLTLHEDYEEHAYPRLTPLSTCPVCHNAVAAHARRPAQLALRAGRPGSGPYAGMPAHANADTVLHHLYKVIPLIPKWNKDTSTCHEFLGAVERTLGLSNSPKQQWYRVLPLLFAPSDTASAKWVQTHIVEECPDSWDEACALFTAHFQRADHLQTLGRKFGQCRHGFKKSVQEYGDRFLSLCEELSIDCNSRSRL